MWSTVRRFSAKKQPATWLWRLYFLQQSAIKPRRRGGTICRRERITKSNRQSGGVAALDSGADTHTPVSELSPAVDGGDPSDRALGSVPTESSSRRGSMCQQSSGHPPGSLAAADGISRVAPSLVAVGAYSVPRILLANLGTRTQGRIKNRL
jgi:hypothetical protein